MTITRRAIRELTAFTLDLQRKTIPATAVLQDFRIGAGHEGLLAHAPNLASFHYGGVIHFNMASEIVDATRVIEKPD